MEEDNESKLEKNASEDSTIISEDKKIISDNNQIQDFMGYWCDGKKIDFMGYEYGGMDDIL